MNPALIYRGIGVFEKIVDQDFFLKSVCRGAGRGGVGVSKEGGWVSTAFNQEGMDFVGVMLFTQQVFHVECLLFF